jgi:hypothetical protein
VATAAFEVLARLVFAAELVLAVTLVVVVFFGGSAFAGAFFAEVGFLGTGVF